METEPYALDVIHVPERLRSHINSERLDALAESMKKIGLMTPITVYHGEYATEDGEIFGGPILIAGLHRLRAAQKLGWPRIQCVVSKASETDRRMWEIAENLHRAELTVQERAEHVAEWVRLSEQSAQLAPKGLGHRPRGGINEAARELRMERTDVQRAVKIDSIAPEAKQAAKAANIDDNQSALLKVASAPKEKQVEEVKRLANLKTRFVSPAYTASERRIKAAQDAFLKLSAEERRVFVEWVEENAPSVFNAA